MQRQPFIAAFILFSSVISPFRPVAAQQKIMLKLNWAKIKKYHCDITMHQDSHETMNGREISTSSDIISGYTMQPERQDSAGNTIVSASYDQFAYSISNLNTGKKFGYDSDHPDDTVANGNPNISMLSRVLKQLFSGLLHKNFQFTITPEGKVISVTGINEMMAASISQLHALPDNLKNGMKTTMEKIFSNKAAQEAFNKAFNIYTNHPVGVGDKWEKSVTITAPLAMKTISDYKVSSIQDKIVSLTTNSDFTTFKSAQSGINTDLKGTQSGTIEVDRKNGLPIQMDLKQQIKITSNAYNMSVPMEMDGTVKIRATEM